MSTAAQIAANHANSQLSTGPKTETGKAAAARNNFRHGLAPSSAFWVLPSESQSDFDNLLAAFRDEHRPATPTEEALVQAMAEHHWLRHRALRLEESCFDFTTGQVIDAQKLSLYLRYQTTHERAFHKALNDLLKLRAEKRKVGNWLRTAAASAWPNKPANRRSTRWPKNATSPLFCLPTPVSSLPIPVSSMHAEQYGCISD